MDDPTIITLFSLACLLVFMCTAILQGHNGYLIYLTIFIFSSAAGLVLPQPGWFKGGK